MSLEVFQLICDRLREKNLLRDTRYTTVDQLYIFLRITTSGASNLVAQERFMHSSETISRLAKKVLHAINMLAPEYMRMPSPSNTNLHLISPEIANSPKIFPFFKSFIGAINGSLIPVRVGQNVAPSHRTRKGFTAHNVFIACSFDCTIQFSLNGWEGSAYESSVLADAIAKGFRVPTGKHHLVDGGYRISPQFLTPYRGVRYHLRERIVSDQT